MNATSMAVVILGVILGVIVAIALLKILGVM